MCITTLCSHIFSIRFMELHPVGYLAIDKEGKSFNFRQSKGNNSSITNNNLMELQMKNHIMVIYI